MLFDGDDAHRFHLSFQLCRSFGGAFYGGIGGGGQRKSAVGRRGRLGEPSAKGKRYDDAVVEAF